DTGVYNTFVRIGIAGMGFMGVTHLGALSKLPDVEVAAICSANPKVLAGDLSGIGGNLKREEVSFDFSSVRKHKAWEDMVADDELDAIDICLPTHLHRPLAVAALKAGKHVICEKPMSGSPDDCHAMLQAAADSGRQLMIAHVLRFWPEYRRLHEFVSSGEHGAVRAATFIRRCGIPDWSRWLTNEGESGGAILDLLIHDIDQILMLFGIPDRIAAKSMGGPDSLSAAFIYGSKIEVRLQGGWFEPGVPFSMGFQVRADRALLELTPEGLMLSDATGQRRKVEAGNEDPYAAELAYFVECCRSGKTPTRCPPSDSAKAVEIALLLKQSREQEGAQLKCSA
ncbi:MAG: gfo/Idh/MocA family oxidoreductase, partial [Bryobacterales bacterium]|nr:gfo/Idh/MocA family oxidoreductase [Bryobacterales bacterium]